MRWYHRIVTSFFISLATFLITLLTAKSFSPWQILVTNLQWSTPVKVGEVGAYMELPAMVVDGNNTVHAIWKKGLQPSLYYAYKVKDGFWSSPEVIYSGERSIDSYDLTADSSGRIHAVFYDVNQLYYLTREVNGHWTAPTIIPINKVKGVRIFVFGNTVHIIYLRSLSCAVDEIYHIMKIGAGNWSTPVQVSNSGRHTDLGASGIDKNGYIHLTFVYWGGGYYYDYLMYTSFSDGSWNTPIEIDHESHENGGLNACFVIDHENTLHMIETKSGTSLYRIKPPGGVWSSPQSLPTSHWYWAIAVNGDKELYAFYPSPDTGINYIQKTGDVWVGPFHVPNTECSVNDICDIYPKVVIDNEEFLHLIWQHIDLSAGCLDIYYSMGTPMPTPTPTPPPVSGEIGSEGGSLMHSYPGHITLLEVPPGAVSNRTIFTITYHAPLPTGPLIGMDHFFEVLAEQTIFTTPLTLTVAYSESVRGPIIAGTEKLYRWQNGSWTTEGITLVNRWREGLTAHISHLSLFGVLGETNRVYLPFVLKKY